MSGKKTATRKGLLTHVRNIGIFAHVDAGKTTCTDRILYFSGAQHWIGDINDGNTTTDFNDQERERGITIFSAAVTLPWDGNTINVIDTPGHVDFTMEVERSMRVLDGGVLVVCAKGGVQPQTRTVWRQANRYHVPRLVFVNKMDATGADFDRAVQSLETNLTAHDGMKPVRMQLPLGEAEKFSGVIDVLRGVSIVWDASDQSGSTFSEEPVPDSMKDAYEAARQELVEAICETDDELLERYFEDEDSITTEDLVKALRSAVVSMKIVPVFCGTAHKSKGIQPLLDAVVAYLPSPTEVPAVVGQTADGEEVTRSASPDEPLSALVFKVVNEVHGSLYFTRVYSGKVEAGSYVWNSTRGKKERVSRIVKMQGNKREDASSLSAGDIGVLMGLKVSTTGNTLCAEGDDMQLESIECPEPVISMAVEPQTQNDTQRLSDALARLASEDPSFIVVRDEETGQIVVKGQGELHLQVTLERMKREDDVVVTPGDPQVAFRESIRTTASVDHKFKKQTGGSGMYARVVLTVEPLERGAGFEFVNQVVGGRIPTQFISSVEKGVRDGLVNGPIANSPVVDVRVTVTDGDAHSVDSSDTAFQIAASMACKEALAKAKPVLLEPVMSMEVEVPDEFMGTVLGDLGTRRGEVKGSDMKAGVAIVKATAPLVEVFGYSSYLRNSSRGEGLFSMEFSHYGEVPDSRAAELAKKA